MKPFVLPTKLYNKIIMSRIHRDKSELIWKNIIKSISILFELKVLGET